MLKYFIRILEIVLRYSRGTQLEAPCTSKVTTTQLRLIANSISKMILLKLVRYIWVLI